MDSRAARVLTRDYPVYLKGKVTMTEATPAPAAPLSEADDKLWAGLSHLGGIILAFVAPLLIWIILKDRGARTAVESKEALNFQITVAIGQVAIFIINAILTAVTLGLWGLIGWILPLALWVVALIFSIMGFQKVNAGGSYRYPFALRLIK